MVKRSEFIDGVIHCRLKKQLKQSGTLCETTPQPDCRKCDYLKKMTSMYEPKEEEMLKL